MDFLSPTAIQKASAQVELFADDYRRTRKKFTRGILTVAKTVTIPGRFFAMAGDQNRN